MEDPKTFSAPVTALDGSSHASGEELPIPFHDARPDLESKTADADHKQPLDLQGHEKCDVCASCGHVVTKAREQYKENNARQADSNEGDQIENGVKHDDLEANTSKSSEISDSSEEKNSDTVNPNIVDWDGPEDPTNPMNWPAWKVKAHIFLVSAITFIR